MLFSKLFKWDENIVIPSTNETKKIPDKLNKIIYKSDKINTIKKVKSIDAVSKLLNEDPFFLSC